MNETPADKKPSQPLPPKQPDGLVRIKCKHIYFGDAFDLAFGSSSSQISNVACYQVGENRTGFEADFLPAWQMFEIWQMSGAWERVGESQFVTASYIRRWLKA